MSLSLSHSCISFITVMRTPIGVSLTHQLHILPQPKMLLFNSPEPIFNCRCHLPPSPLLHLQINNQKLAENGSSPNFVKYFMLYALFSFVFHCLVKLRPSGSFSPLSFIVSFFYIFIPKCLAPRIR